MPGDGSAPTLTDRRGLGGIVAQDGFDYQLFDGLLRVPGWLANPGFEQMMYEGLEDLEARFFSPYAPQLHVLERFQAKSADLKPGDVREVFESFREFEEAFPNTARVQTLVTPRLPPALGWLRRDPSRVRQARPFYKPFPDVVSASDESLTARCIDAFGEPLGPFVSDSVEISERSVLDRECAIHSFSRELHRTFPTLEYRPGNPDSAFDALAALARSNLGAPLVRSDLESLLEERLEQEFPLPRAFPLHVLSDRNEANPGALQIDASAFSGGVTPFPAAETWASDLIAPLGKTAAWLRGRGVCRVALGGSYRLTTAMAIGWSLRSAHGFELDVPTREGIWGTDDRPQSGQSGPDWTIEEPDSLHRDHLAVSVGVLRNPSVDLPDTAGVPRRSILGIHLPAALASAPEAQASVSIVKRKVDECITRLRPHGIQLYMACPAALAVVLGHRWNGIPPTSLYEYLAAERRYVKTAILPV